MIPILILLSIIYSQDCTEGRYIEELFNVNIQYDIEYGENINQNIINSDYTQTLYKETRRVMIFSQKNCGIRI